MCGAGWRRTPLLITDAKVIKFLLIYNKNVSLVGGIVEFPDKTRGGRARQDVAELCRSEA